MRTVISRILFIVFQYAGYLYLAYGVDRANFAEVLAVFAFLFAGMIIFMRRRKELVWRDIFWTALFFRAAFLLSEPRLSDDYYRFIWDGAITVSGENPYLILPEDYASTDAAKAIGIDGPIYEGMNSKGYYTVYPPVNQLLFAFCVWTGRGDPATMLLYMHCILLLFEALLLHLMRKLLEHFKFPLVFILGYAFNPLVISELTGNLHFEGAMLSMMALSVWWYLKPPISGKFGWLLAAVPLALAVSIKLTPLLLFPLIWALLRKRFIPFGIATGLTLLLTFLPFYSTELITHWQSSLGLYFRTFEFNASVYYVLRTIGEWIYGYNTIATIGPALSLLTVLSIVLLAIKVLRSKKPTATWVMEHAKWSYLVFYILSTTVHPWYAAIPAAMAVFTHRKEAWFWSFLVVFSYSHYDAGGFQEHYPWIIAEYVLLALVILAPAKMKASFKEKVLSGYPE